MLLVRLSSNGRITLPEPVRQEMNLSTGDFLRVEIRQGSIILTPVVLMDRSDSEQEDKDNDER